MSGVLVHEWIAQDGGSENVLQAMAETFPDADIRCLWNDSVGRFDPARVQESWLARTPLRRSKALSLPLMPLTWRLLRDRGYDWALISSHAFAHHARFRGASGSLRRMVYVHTPARYVWTPTSDTRGEHPVVRLASRVLQPLDRHRAREGAEFAANSAYVRERIRKAWDVDARVIHPPVNVERIQSVSDWRSELTPAEARVLDGLPEGYVLGASRFIPYKRLEQVIRTGEVIDRPVVLAGHGPSRAELAERAAEARVPVTFVDAPSTALLYALYQRAGLYVFPAVEDFGIMPVEAMAAGAPVLAQAEGGAAESVVDGLTGALVRFDSDDEVRRGAEAALATVRADRVRRAKDFATSRFRQEMASWVGGAMSPILINRSFATQRVTGQQRYAMEVASRLERTDGYTGIEPTGFWARSTLRTWAWVQAVLPFAARRSVVLSMTARAPLWRRRHVLVVHDLFVLTNPEWYSRRYIWTHAPLLRAQLRSAAAVVAVSRPVADQLEAVRGAPVEVAPNAPSEVFSRDPGTDPDDDALRARGLEPDGYFLAVGSKDPRKNLPRLAAAYGQLSADDRRRFPLVVVGGTNAIFRGEALTWPEGTIDAGYIPDVELRQLYRHARCVVFVALAEGFGLPLVEAAAAGTRGLLASDIPVFRWICGETVRYVDPTSIDDISEGLRGEIENPQSLKTETEMPSWSVAVSVIEDVCRRTSDAT